MRFYKVTAPGKTVYVGSQGDAAAKRKELNSSGVPRKDIATVEVDVPTDKVGLLGWLNAQAA